MDFLKIIKIKIINIKIIFIKFFLLYIFIMLQSLSLPKAYDRIKNDIIFYDNLNCKKLNKLYNKKNEYVPKHPFLSLILPTYNMEKYLCKLIGSILNQSFNNFEIIIINDCSNDKTENLIQEFLFKLKKIKIINHSDNLGVYISRVDGVLNAKGKYILFIDPDDMLLNKDLFKEIYYYNLEYNLDIIEFIVYYKNEGETNLYMPVDHKLNHFHNFSQKIIYQPELSNILFFDPRNKSYTDIICRTIWNKIIKKEILMKTINFIGLDTNKNKYFNLAEDTIMNVLNFQYASNYSNIYLPGYMYNIRKESITHGDFEIKHIMMICKSSLIYLNLLYKYIIFFNKNRNYLLYEIKEMKYYLLKLKYFNLTSLIFYTKEYLNYILNDVYISKDLKIFVKNLSMIFNN